MLRDLLTVESRTQGASSPEATATIGVPRNRPRLLIVHHGDPRLAALELVLSDLGYGAIIVGTAEEAIAAIARGPLPDVLLTTCIWGTTRRGVTFARDCLARWPNLRALYLSFIPGSGPEIPSKQERTLTAPVTAEQLAAGLEFLWSRNAAGNDIGR